MKKIILLVSTLCLLTSCSVAMAAKKEGISVTQVQAYHTRAQIITSGASLVDSYWLESGELMETYRIQKERGSAARAFMHGVLDVSTCGLWEVVGTPIESCSSKREFYFIRVVYDANENVKKIELL